MSILSPKPSAGERLVHPSLRSTVLFANFFLIITALYHLKPASRSLVLESLGTQSLPYIWIASAVTLFLLISLYHRILSRYSRLQVVLGTCVVFILCLLLLRLLLLTSYNIVPAVFYIFVDIFGVVLVEQFWSLTNSIYSTEEGKRWYGIVGTGGLAGGVVGGGVAALVISYTPLQTPDLLLVAAFIVGLIYGLTCMMAHFRMYVEVNPSLPGDGSKGGLRTLLHNRYLLLIAAALLLAQLVSPLVEYQFLRIIEIRFPEREARTAILSLLFSLLNAVSIAVNIFITPLVLRYLGVLAGLLVQPVVLATSSYGFSLHPSLWPAATMKISDRGLSYSINRASRELLYIPVERVLMYRAKAWIDMFGYRLFKILGAMLILLLTQWTTIVTGYVDLSWFIISGCFVWVLILLVLHREYSSLAMPVLLPNSRD
ncbi:Npt1/Npt2 family nucleotide transporter [Sulfuriflexus sp.]|uniref:Npt1/Npt2 family nucleotide transporter n=1 Tax=Sulfuriflexus sp. TaxID=2015443 RepID=UPI0028CD16B6|nr:Npt1/Npt2 family nucleotide transporter [Sulfuriflexus sp.]MDT8403246.1 Npt1/Npt2 family nucleotide transporter [Sulfuriflexus sp.]